jgi:glycosyltransferase involved in cell wall biosynthesis
VRILHTEWSDDLGGQEKRVLAEVAGLSERNHYVAIMCREHAKIRAEATGLGIDVHTIPMRKPYDLQSILRMVKFLKAGNFDIVNTHSGVDSWIGGIAARIAGVRVLVRTRHLNIPLRRGLLNFIHYLPDMYITCGENIRETLIGRCGFPADKVVSIPTGVSPAFFHVRRNTEAKIRYGLDKNSIVIANVGILRSVKGHEVTLKAVRRVTDAFPGAKFLIVGDGPRRKILESLVNTLKISEHVIFTGFVEDIPEVYSFTDIAVLSSWSEGLPQSVLQAMAAGVPVVATEVGGVPEVIEHEKTGMLVAPGDHEALAAAVIKMLEDPLLSKRMAGRAKDLAEKEHSAGHMLDRIEDLYRDMLTKKRG